MHLKAIASFFFFFLSKSSEYKLSSWQIISANPLPILATFSKAKEVFIIYSGYLQIHCPEWEPLKATERGVLHMLLTQ